MAPRSQAIAFAARACSAFLPARAQGSSAPLVADLLLSTYGEQTRTVYRQSLAIAARVLSGGKFEDPALLEWSALSAQHVAAYRTALEDAGYAPATITLHCGVLRRVAHAAWRAQLISDADWARVRDERICGRGARLPPGRALTYTEIERILVACQDPRDPARGARDAAMIALGYGCGLRRAELLGLERRDVEPPWLTVRRAKGGRQRRVAIPEGALVALGWHLFSWPVAADPQAALFESGNGRRLSASAAARAVAARALAAGLKPITTHDLRRSCVSAVLAAGLDLATAQAVAGHSSPAVTARYDRRGDARLLAAARALTVPTAGRIPTIPALPAAAAEEGAPAGARSLPAAAAEEGAPARARAILPDRKGSAIDPTLAPAKPGKRRSKEE